MKFLVKNKETKIPEGYKEVDIPVVEISLIASAVPFVISHFPAGFNPTTVAICTKITSGMIALGSLPFTTLASGVVVLFSSALFVSELVDFINEKMEEKKLSDNTEIEKELSKLLKHKIKMQKSLSTSVIKEEQE